MQRYKKNLIYATLHSTINILQKSRPIDSFLAKEEYPRRVGYTNCLIHIIPYMFANHTPIRIAKNEIRHLALVIGLFRIDE